MNFTAYLDTSDNTVSVYPSTSSRRIVLIEGVKSEGQARSALTRRGFTVTETGEYAYGSTFTGTAAAAKTR